MMKLESLDTKMDELLALVGRLTLEREPLDAVLDDMPPEIMSTPEDVVAMEERLNDRVYKRSLVITLDTLFFNSIRIRFIYSLYFHGWGNTYICTCVNTCTQKYITYRYIHVIVCITYIFTHVHMYDMRTCSI